MTTTTIRLHGHEAIAFAEQHDMLLSKYNDPTEDARDDLDVSEAREVAREDHELIYLELPVTTTSEETGFAYHIRAHSEWATVVWIDADHAQVIEEGSCPGGVLAACDVPVGDQALISNTVLGLSRAT